MVKVVENKVPEKVLCTAEAYPEASFMWRFNDEIIQTQVRYLGLLDSIKDVDGCSLKTSDILTNLMIVIHSLQDLISYIWYISSYILYFDKSFILCRTFSTLVLL